MCDGGRDDVADVAVRELVDEAELFGLGRRDQFAGHDEIECGLDANEAGKPLGATGSGNDAEGDFGKANASIGAGYARVAAERELETSARGDAVNRGDDGFGGGFDSVDHVGELWRVWWWLLSELADVGASAEHFSSARDHDSLDVGVSECFSKLFSKRSAHRGAEPVDGWVVDR